MDIIDRLLAHDTWTTSQLLLACKMLKNDQLDQPFEIDHKTLRATFLHIIENMEVWTDLLYERTAAAIEGDQIEQLLERLSKVSREFEELTRRIVREGRSDDYFLDTLDNPPQKKTFGGAIGHVITHNMHHRAQVMFLMERIGIKDHIEGDLLSWESEVLGRK
ncbi:MAG: DinB family protein [Chloroflexota bacterium]